MRHKVVNATPEQLQKSLLARDYVDPRPKMKTSHRKPKDPVIGQTIMEVRPMTQEELAAEGWYGTRHGMPYCLVLGNGMRVFAMRDPEGNGPGELVAVTADGKGRMGWY